MQPEPGDGDRAERSGASNQQSPAENRHRLTETKRKERAGQTASVRQDSGITRAALYDEATRKEIAGRSRMSKAELRAALGKAG